MAKLTTLWQSIKIEYISVNDIDDGVLRIGGTVMESNFLAKGRRSLMPVNSKNTENILAIGDVIKVTLFTPKGESKEDSDGESKTITFKDCGSKYEIWNKEEGGWDKIYEFFRDVDS